MMELAALVLLDDNPDAVKLVATWPVAGKGAGNSADDITEAGEVGEDIAAKWSTISGVDIEDLERLTPILFLNGILEAGGAVDTNALRYVNAKVAAKLPKASRG